MVTRLLITGTGRCGTRWASEALTAAGLPCTHEHAYTHRRHGTEDWIADSSWKAAPYLPTPSGTHVVHLVRNPLATIRSRASVNQPGPVGGTLGDPPTGNGKWIYRHAPHIALWPTTIERCAAHWVAWNRMIAPHADERIRLEDITTGTINRLARIVDPNAAGVTVLPPPSNGKRHTVPPLWWSDVAHIPGLVDLAHEYGYR